MRKEESSKQTLNIDYWKSPSSDSLFLAFQKQSLSSGLWLTLHVKRHWIEVKQGAYISLSSHSSLQEVAPRNDALDQ